METGYPGLGQRQAATTVQRTFLTRVYGLMAVGLGITAVTALSMAASPALMQMFFGNPFMFYGAFIAELALVVVFSARVAKASVSTSTAMLLAYSVLNGITMSFIFLRYTGTSIFGTFVVAAGMFGGLSLYGAATKKDLSSWGSFGMMGLWGVILAGIVNIFLGSSLMGFVISVAGVATFVALTAYDTQKIQALYNHQSSEDDQTRLALSGALTLYLDFVNLFLFLLRLLGGGRKD
jgi:FtsH-binding integral membrane protein